jgi:hypothetical protein
MTVALIQNGVVLEYREDSALNTNQSALPPNKPKLVPVVEQNATYNSVTQVRVEPPAVTVEATRVLWTYTVRAKNPAEIDSMRNGKLAQVRSEADSRLSKIGTFAQQSWALTRLVQMLYANTDWHAWASQPQIDLATTMLARLNNMVNVRQVQDSKDQELQALTDPTAINAYDPKAGWPA